jgi:undecaprenyl-diphosphatase
MLMVDQALLLGVRRWESAFLTRLMKGFTRLGDPATWVATGLALGLSGGNGPRYACLLGLGATLAVCSSQVLKRVCCRARPDCGIGGFSALAENPDAFSFPSGHTSAAFAIAVALSGEGSGLGALTLVLALGIALSRIYLGAHYPLDVAAGIVVGALSGLAAEILVDGAHLLVLGYGIFRVLRLAA